jgi:GT2 family glycosyltransferase
MYTFSCLLSIAEVTGADTPYEVIVVDNASSDDTPAMLTQVENMRVIRNEENLGFVDACNAGAAAARGDYVLFLNNDTMVTPGWLSSLVRIFEQDPQCGAAGSKLIYPDGRLQEAGGIIWSNATGWNYGKFDDPEKPEYNYVREVDYCSGAALMIRRSLLERIGGFDRR